MAVDLGINKIMKTLSEKEKALDFVLTENRKAVRACSNSIKCMHAYDMKKAKVHLAEADAAIKDLKKYEERFPNHLAHIYQEYAEAHIVLSAIETKKIPSFAKLKIPEVPYLNGLLDAVGELKREMYEALRHGKKKDAEFYFKLMEEIYDELLPLRFSNSVLPEFRKKQDNARRQIEQARGELI